MRTRLFVCLLLAVCPIPARAAVIVIANYTPTDAEFTLVEVGGKPRTHTLPAYQVAPFVVAGPADLAATTAPGGAKQPLRVDPYHAYAFIPDRSGLRVELLELPGATPERDTRPELNAPDRKRVKIPVTLLVDDIDPRADALWHAETRKRFEAASGILEAQTGFRFEFAAYDTWKSDPKAKQVEAQRATLEGAVVVKPGALAIGFTNRKLDEGKNTPFGACAGRGAAHILVRESAPKNESERVEVLVRYLAVSLGAVGSPDPGSAMRPNLGDGQAGKRGFVVRLDPLNVLALNLWADQHRLGVKNPANLPEIERIRLVRVYTALLLASPGDATAADAVRELEKDAGKLPDLSAKKDPVRVDRTKRAAAIRAVILAVTERAKANAGDTALTGDTLTTELLRVAADAALKCEEPDRAAAFLLGIGVALDDSTALRDNPLTSAAVRDAESDAERKERLAVLGNPTLRHRRDLCKRFVQGCAAGELLTVVAAEGGAVGGGMLAMHRPAGFGFPGLAAEFAGITFARSLRADPTILTRIQGAFAVAELIPSPTGLRDGLGAENFDDEFGDTEDPRFTDTLTEIRKRIKALSVNIGK